MSKLLLLNQLQGLDRGGYYDRSGALKDMVQNHALKSSVTF